MKQKIYNKAPAIVKNIMVTIYNLRFKKIYNNNYKLKLKEAEEFFYNYSKEELYALQNKRFMEFIDFAKKNNEYYKNLLDLIEVKNIKNIVKIPLLSKEDLRNMKISSRIDDDLMKGHTGGSTGKSLKFYLTRDDFIQRQATLNFFRGMYGYKIGDKIGWFSGKELIGPNDEKKNIFWVKDYIHNITYYSTFHLGAEQIDAMIDYMNKSKLEYFSGFPSAMYEIAKRWKQTGVKVDIQLKAIFPTAEPLYEYQKEFLEEFFKCPVPDQYASSEGAHFIYECPRGNLHYDVTTGVFEKISEASDEVLVTSFTTHAMPLIRYKIGDKILLDKTDQMCECGSHMPIVEKIIGRSVAFVYSKERGKITVSNISNVVKYLQTIDNIQLIQDSMDEIIVKVVCPNCDQEKIIKDLEYELRYRLGDKIKLHYEFVKEIPHEKNGKYMMIKNSLDI